MPNDVKALTCRPLRNGANRDQTGDLLLAKTLLNRVIRC